MTMFTPAYGSNTEPTTITYKVTVTVDPYEWEKMGRGPYRDFTWCDIEHNHVRNLIADTLHSEMTPHLEAQVEVELDHIVISPVTTVD
jgi:hypothetical protein